jgi:autophagy-related protein 27
VHFPIPIWTTILFCFVSAGQADTFFYSVFIGVTAYLIFGSWLNYNRYGARGWDLLPHGDTIRDIPYLMKDWTRRVFNSVQGSGSRGGYSAV